MNEQLTKQLIRQLKILNIWLAVFGVTMIIGFIVLGVLIFKIVTFMQDASDKINNLEQRTQKVLNTQKELCDSSTVGTFIKRNTDVCK
jgi:hypothetical protein